MERTRSNTSTVAVTAGLSMMYTSVVAPYILSFGSGEGERDHETDHKNRELHLLPVLLSGHLPEGQEAWMENHLDG